MMMLRLWMLKPQVFGAMPSFTEDPAYLNRKTNDFERTDVTGAVMYRGRLMPCMRCGEKSRMIFGSRSDPMFVCESRECHNVLSESRILLLMECHLCKSIVPKV